MLNRGGVVLDEATRGEIRRMVDARGVRQTSIALRVSPMTIARALAALKVQRGTATHLTVRLAEHAAA